MDIKALEKKYNNFYAPSFVILVDGKDLLTKMHMEITSVQVDNTLEGADRFTFTINNAFDIQKREFQWLNDFFTFGKRVEIKMGYLNTLELLHVGVITSVGTSFPAGGLPQINVSGYDLMHCMTKGKHSPRPWNDKKDSDVAAEIAGKYNLNSVVQNTEVIHPRIEQSQESDYQFLKKLAERNGFEIYVFLDKLYFQEPFKEKKGVVTLEWGKGLLSFSPEINISEQVSEVEVRGWDVKTKKEIVGKARAGDVPGKAGGGKSGGETVQSTCKETPALKVRQPVYSKEQAEKIAKAILKKRSEGFVKGSGESIGIPLIRADKMIELLGLGKKFSRTYYIEQSTHTINASGYKTTFRIKDTTI